MSSFRDQKTNYPKALGNVILIWYAHGLLHSIFGHHVLSARECYTQKSNDKTTV